MMPVGGATVAWASLGQGLWAAVRALPWVRPNLPGRRGPCHGAGGGQSQADSSSCLHRTARSRSDLSPSLSRWGN